MKHFLLSCILGLGITAPSFSAQTSLWDELLNVVVTHVKRDGPDSNTAQFISMAPHQVWARRTEVVELVSPFLADKNSDKVAGAIEVLYRFRCYRPASHLGDSESEHAPFFADLDKEGYQHFDHFRELKSAGVYRTLALYLGVSRTPRAKRELLAIARSPIAAGAKEQALIGLAWHRDRADMDTLLPFMLEDSPAARSLPYRFRNSYGAAALPYLRKTLTEAKSEATRREAEKQLRLLEHK